MIQALLYFGAAVTGDLAICVLAAWPGDIECAVGQDPLAIVAARFGGAIIFFSAPNATPAQPGISKITTAVEFRITSTLYVRKGPVESGQNELYRATPMTLSRVDTY